MAASYHTLAVKYVHCIKQHVLKLTLYSKEQIYLLLQRVRIIAVLYIRIHIIILKVKWIYKYNYSSNKIDTGKAN